MAQLKAKYSGTHRGAYAAPLAYVFLSSIFYRLSSLSHQLIGEFILAAEIGSSRPYMAFVAAVSWLRSTASGTALCIRKAPVESSFKNLRDTRRIRTFVIEMYHSAIFYLGSSVSIFG